MAQVIPLRPHTFRLDNCVIDDYAAEMGAIGVAIYAVLQRYADRTTGQCWPSVSTMAATLRLSKNCVKKYLHHLARLGLIDMAPRYTADGDHTSNLYTVHDPTQTEALLRRRRQQGGAPAAGGGALDALPPQDNGHLVTQGGAPDDHEQDPQEQEALTSVFEEKTAEPVCDHPEHEHWSPVPEFVLCLDCFRSWEVPREVIPLVLDLEGSAAADHGVQPVAPARPLLPAARRRAAATSGSAGAARRARKPRRGWRRARRPATYRTLCRQGRPALPVHRAAPC